MSRPPAARVPAPGQPDHFLARIIHLTLVSGLVISVAAMAAGLIMAASGLAAAATMLMKTGLLALLATPVLRVVIAVIGYVVERDWLFTAISVLVLALLVISYWAGHA